MVAMTKLNSDNRRVVVTGLGVVSSVGIGWEEFWKNLLAGKSGISRIESFDTSQYDRHYGGEVKNFDPTKFMTKRRAASIGRSSQMAIAASKLALKDAHIDLNKKSRIACSIGTTLGERRLIELFDKDRLLHQKAGLVNEQLNMCSTESLAFNVGLELKLNGQIHVLSTACAAGNYAIGEGFDLIKSGRFEYALAGGADSFSQMVYTGFCVLHAVAPEKCQPFDKNRKGIIPAEGAGMVLLESLESARRRKAHIYAEVLGYGLSCDAFHMTESKVDGIAKGLRNALINAAIKPEDVDYISAHGTGTPENDETECKAINQIFGSRTKQIPVSSIKSMIGHTMGAASALGAIACCLAIKDYQIPPTINHEHNDPNCPIDCVPNKMRSLKIKTLLNNAQAFGGNNACVIFSNEEEET